MKNRSAHVQDFLDLVEIRASRFITPSNKLWATVAYLKKYPHYNFITKTELVPVSEQNNV